MQARHTLLTLVITALIMCGCSPKGSEAPSAEPVQASAEDTSLIEAAYLSEHDKIDDSYFFVSDSKDFIMQIPNSVKVEKLKDSQDLESYSFSIDGAGSVSVYTKEQKYQSRSREDIEAGYLPMSPDITGIDDFTVIMRNGEEVGRTFAISYTEGSHIYIREYACGEGTLVALGQPSANSSDEDLIRRYADAVSVIRYDQ